MLNSSANRQGGHYSGINLPQAEDSCGHDICSVYPLGSTITWLAGKWTRIEDVWILLKLGIFQPAMLVYWRVYLDLSSTIMCIFPLKKPDQKVGYLVHTLQGTITYPLQKGTFVESMVFLFPRWDTPWKFNSSPLKIYPKGKDRLPLPSFSGANC